MLGFEIHPFIRLLFWFLVVLVICYAFNVSLAQLLNDVVNAIKGMHAHMAQSQGR